PAAGEGGGRHRRSGGVGQCGGAVLRRPDRLPDRAADDRLRGRAQRYPHRHCLRRALPAAQPGACRPAPVPPGTRRAQSRSRRSRSAVMRIAVAGLHIECSTYNPVLNREADFRVLRGPAMLKDQYFDFLRHFPAEFITILHARAIAGGPVARDTYETWKGEILVGLRAAQPLDGVYLPMHGAMFVEGLFDAEGDFIAAVREAVGPDVPISASYDLHGNISQKIIDNLDMFSTYRTAPHIDVPDTMRRAVTMLVRALKTGVRPKLAWAPVPV